MRARLPVLIGAFALAGVGVAHAHHSFSTFDRDKTVTLTGVVKEYVWANPHVLIAMLHEGAKGPVLWSIEGSSPGVLARGGWTATLLKPGDRISLGLHPRKDGSAGGLLADEQQLLVNGKPPKGVLWLTPPGEECDR